MFEVFALGTLSFLLAFLSTVAAFTIWIRNVSDTLDVGSGIIGLCIAFLLGHTLARWSKLEGHLFAYMSGVFAGSLLILVPFVVVTYGFAIIAAPYFLLWVGTNGLGFWTGTRAKAPSAP